ncbi:hypothetical protein ACLB1S_24340 [Escherichia coli]
MILNETAWFGRGAAGQLVTSERWGYHKAPHHQLQNAAQMRRVKVTDNMQAAGLAWAIYDGVVPNRQFTVKEAG